MKRSSKAIMRRIMKDILYRYEENPLITQEDIPFRCNTVFNASPVKFNEEYLLLMRVEGQQGYSFFTLARSNKGLAYRVDESPAMVPATSGKFAKYEERGIEDPRITYLDGTYYILYTAYSRYGARIAIAALLLSFEMVTYWSLRVDLEAARWYMLLGILRDMVFLVMALEVLIWYKNSLDAINRKVSEIKNPTLLPLDSM
jgi:hypothetical protein